jgi:hypothetical protein
MILGTLKYHFEDVPLLRLGDNAVAGMVSGEATIHIDCTTRKWKIETISVLNDAAIRVGTAPIALLPDHGPEACGPFELVHDALHIECGDRIESEINRMLDSGNREGRII